MKINGRTSAFRAGRSKRSKHMRISKNYSSSGKKSLLIIFIIMFIAIFGAMIFGAQHESKAAAKIEESRSEIELVHDENGRIVLTDALLRSDYSVYVKNADTNIKVMNIVMIALLAALVGWFIVTLVGFIRGRMRGEPINIIQIISLVLPLCIVIILGVLFFNGAKQTYEKKPEDPESATISLEYAQVVRKDTRKVTSGRGKHKTSHTEYNIYLSDGRELSVVKYVYNEVDGAGNYYIGKNEAGSIFGMYPESSYCMEEI